MCRNENIGIWKSKKINIWWYCIWKGSLLGTKFYETKKNIWFFMYILDWCQCQLCIYLEIQRAMTVLYFALSVEKTKWKVCWLQKRSKLYSKQLQSAKEIFGIFCWNRTGHMRILLGWLEEFWMEANAPFVFSLKGLEYNCFRTKNALI